MDPPADGAVTGAIVDLSVADTEYAETREVELATATLWRMARSDLEDVANTVPTKLSHDSVTLLALLVLRIVIRLLHYPPPLPATIRGVERRVAHLGHAALYALPALVIAAGWAETNFGGHAVQWFGVELPRIFPKTGEDLQDLSEDLHMWLAYGMLAVAAGHVAAAFKHRWFDDHDVIRHMTFGGR